MTNCKGARTADAVWGRGGRKKNVPLFCHQKGAISHTMHHGRQHNGGNKAWREERAKKRTNERDRANPSFKRWKEQLCSNLRFQYRKGGSESEGERGQIGFRSTKIQFAYAIVFRSCRYSPATRAVTGAVASFQPVRVGRERPRNSSK